ncbi:MAG: hypothetical protein ACW99F_05345, partial [Candidatus Hodarchaeales archaeon]
WLSGIEVSQKDLDRLEVPHSINSENRELSIIQTIASLAQKPILLSFDQLESIYIRFKRDDGIQLLFDSLTNLYNQCRHLLVLAMCQTLVWNESITKEVPEYSRQRIDYITKLEPLSPSNAVALVKARFDVMFLDSGVIPPYATYPFRDDYIAKVAATTDGNPRLFLRQLRDRINEFKDKGQIIELTADEASSDVQKEAVAGVPPITPEEIISSSTTSLSDESAQALMSLTSEEREALADLFPDMEEPPIEQISVSSRTENALEALEEIPSQQPEKSAPTEIINFLEAKWAKYAQEYEMEIFAFPHPVRRDFLKGVLYEILNSAIEKKRPIYGLNILNVRIDRNLVEKDTKGLDLVFTYQTPRGPTSVGIEINNSEHGSTVFQSLRRLKKLVRGNIRFAFILRDEELSLQRTASKSLDLAESLTDYGGLYYIDFLSNQALLATKKLLDLASAGDLVIGTQTVSRNQALSFVFEECLNRISIFQTIFNHLQSSQEPTQKLGSYASESSEAVEAIVTILKFNPSMTIDRLCMLLNRNETDLNPILKMLSIRGLISFDGKNISLL